jgi:LysR family hydrogen peroxide-inducible transcriptional activator
MVANGLGATLVPQLALDAGLLDGTGLAVRPLRGAGAHRDIGLAWQRGSRRRAEFEQLGRALAERLGLNPSAGASSDPPTPRD